MNVSQAKKEKPRFDVGYFQRFDLQAWGRDNLYPQHLSAIASASGTAELCLARYIKFIEGNGLHDTLAYAEINGKGETADDLLHGVAMDVARYGGFAIHVNYNVLGEIVEMQRIPFDQCRLAEPDDSGHVKYILVHPDWMGNTYRSGNRMTVDENYIRTYHAFNPRLEVVQAQMLEAGGTDYYTGQVLWCSMAGKDTYPTPIYDSVISDMSTEAGLGNIKNRNARNNFLPATMMVVKKNAPRFDENGNDITPPSVRGEDLAQFQGDEKTGKILLITLENDEDEPKLIPFNVNNFDKEFAVTDASVIERIYAQFHQELFHSIRLGKLGFSGDVMQDAYMYYAGEVTNEQRFIQRGIDTILSHWYDPVLRDADTQIERLIYGGVR